MLSRLRAYWKSITAIVATLVAAGGVIWGGGDLALKADDWVETAEAAHVLAQTNERVAAQILEYQQKEIQREQAAKAEEQRKRAYITKLCLTGELKSKEECAKVGLSVKMK